VVRIDGAMNKFILILVCDFCLNANGSIFDDVRQKLKLAKKGGGGGGAGHEFDRDFRKSQFQNSLST